LRQDRDGVVVRQEEHRAVGRRGLQGLRGDLAAGTGFVFDDDVGTQGLFEFVGQQAGNRVGATTGRKADHQFDGVGVRQAAQHQATQRQGLDEATACGRENGHEGLHVK
jgi:hypothetical protein